MMSNNMNTPALSRWFTVAILATAATFARNATAEKEIA
jgi:hypothetical protein